MEVGFSPEAEITQERDNFGEWINKHLHIFDKTNRTLISSDYRIRKWNWATDMSQVGRLGGKNGLLGY